jgi:hypothetical protein
VCFDVIAHIYLRFDLLNFAREEAVTVGGRSRVIHSHTHLESGNFHLLSNVSCVRMLMLRFFYSTCLNNI